MAGAEAARQGPTAADPAPHNVAGGALPHCQDPGDLGVGRFPSGMASATVNAPAAARAGAFPGKSAATVRHSRSGVPVDGACPLRAVLKRAPANVNCLRWEWHNPGCTARRRKSAVHLLTQLERSHSVTVNHARTVWVEQCRATMAIRQRFGVESAFDYLVAEKLMVQILILILY